MAIVADGAVPDDEEAYGARKKPETGFDGLGAGGGVGGGAGDGPGGGGVGVGAPQRQYFAGQFGGEKLQLELHHASVT